MYPVSHYLPSSQLVVGCGAIYFYMHVTCCALEAIFKGTNRWADSQQPVSSLPAAVTQLIGLNVIALIGILILYKPPKH